MSAENTTTAAPDGADAKTTQQQRQQHACAVCQAPSTKCCSRCRQVWYCSVDHQREDWKQQHKKQCTGNKTNKVAAAATTTMTTTTAAEDQLTLHKQEFDRIVKAYGLDSEAKSTAIADLLTQDHAASGGVSAADFSQQFGVPPQEAVVFLEWIQKGIKFKEETLDVAKKSGMA